MTQEQPKLRKPQPYAPKYFFVGGLDTVLGNEIVERLRNEHIHPQKPNQIVGTLALQSCGQTERIPQGVRKIIDTNKVSFTKDVILDSDVIIYDLNTCPPDQVEFAISALKMSESKEEQILICISNVMTWARTPRKIKGEEDEPDEADPESEGEPEEEKQQAEQEEKKQGEEPKQYVKFKDSDYALRRPLPSYETVKSLETLCLSAGKVRPSLKSYVICSGILYGKREPMWEKYFYEAIHQNPQSLSYFGKGNNRIPSIHVKDLVTFIQKTIERTPAIPYILALDHNPRPFQKSIIKSISKGIGTGKINQVRDYDQGQIPEFLLINIGMKTSNYFQKIEEEEANIDVEEGEEVEKFTFKWEYKDGIQKSIKKLCEQFKDAMSIKQIKVFIQGPPATGKSFYCEKLSKVYKLPHLHIQQVIQEVLALREDDPLATEVRQYLSEEKTKLIEEGQAKYDQLKEDRKKIPKNERQPLEPFVEQNIKPRLSDQLLCKCYVWRLSQNDCINRGYILDGFPRTYKQAKMIWMYVPEVEGDEQQDEQNKIEVLNVRTAPNKVFLFEASDKYILDFLRAQPEEKLKGTHLTEDDTRRRLKVYRSDNVEHTGTEILEDFFAQNDIIIHKLKISEQNQLDKLLTSMILPISTNESLTQQKLSQTAKQRQQQKQLKKQKQDRREKIERDIQTEDYKIKKQNEQNEEREILDKKSLALRKYLDVNIVPFLSEGLHEILVKLPENPVDYLAEFLFKISLKVPKPDPSAFEF